MLTCVACVRKIRERGWGTGCASMFKLVGRTTGQAQYAVIQRFSWDVHVVMRFVYKGFNADFAGLRL